MAKILGGKIYETGEIVEAATLKASGIPFIKVQPGHRVTLIFDDSNGQASKIAIQHTNNGVPINSAQMAASLAWVKDRIFSAKRIAGD